LETKIIHSVIFRINCWPQNQQPEDFQTTNWKLSAKVSIHFRDS